MIRKSISTTLRITSDIWLREGGVQQLYPASALRIVDHHLHASGIIENSKESVDRLYDHDWFCVSQAVTCFGVEDLLIKSLDDKDFASHSFIFVMGVGTSSIQFGNVITLNDEVLATTRRVFCRKDISGKSAPFTDDEKSRFLESKPPELLYSMPEVEKFGSFLPNPDENVTPVLSVEIGPQHVNMGNHADNAFLVETAIHAMTLAKKDVSSVAVNYVSEAKLGQTLDCIFHSDTLFITRTLPTGRKVVVMVARSARLHTE